MEQRWLIGEGMVRQRGFTYLAVIFMVAIVGVLAAAQGIMWSSVKRHEDREQARFAGEQIVRAIGSYYEQSPSGVKVYPKRLVDLLNDERFPVPRHHLRQLYLNPFGDRPDWTLLMAPDGGIMGVAIEQLSTEVGTKDAGNFVYRPAELEVSPISRAALLFN